MKVNQSQSDFQNKSITNNPCPEQISVYSGLRSESTSVSLLLPAAASSQRFIETQMSVNDVKEPDD